MPELKTKKSKESVADFLASIHDDTKRADCELLVELFEEATGEKGAMWGNSIVGFGSYRYTYKSGHKGEWLLTGFSPRAKNLTLYIMPGFVDYVPLMKKLGKHITGSSCLYLKRFSDVDRATLKELIQESVADMKRKYPEITK